MPTRREFLKKTASAAMIGSTLGGTASAASRPTTEVRRTIGGKAQTAVRIKSLIRREDSVLRYPVTGDNWHMSWASDDQQYVSLCDGPGFLAQPKVSYNSRMLEVCGGPVNAKFHDVPGYPLLGGPAQKPRDTRYYNFGTLALDGNFYQFLSTFNRPFKPNELEKSELDDLLRFNGAKLIHSPDNGRTWHNQNGSTPVIWESWEHRSRDTLVFFKEDQEAFSLLTILQMGRNYEHNKDGYVYVYAPNGNSEGTMNELVMFRVEKNKLLDRSSYEYFAGLATNGNGKWTKDITARAVVHTFPSGWVNILPHPYAWHPSVIYNAPLNTYMMANWGTGSAPNGMWFDKPSYLGFWVAPNPWGPWTQIYEESAWMPAYDKKARAYQPQIAPKWVAADGKSFWLVWTDYQGHDSEGMKQLGERYKVNAEANTLTEGDVTRTAHALRTSMPHYAFNVQRIDLAV